MKVVIPGGSGQVGSVLARHFHAAGHQVTVLSRQPQPAPWRTMNWEGVSELEGADVCINLAGRSVNCRYTAANRRAIYDSRIDSTVLLQKAIESMNSPPRLWLNASTATIYRHTLHRPMDEFTGELGGNEPGAPDTWNFSIDVAKKWEAAFFARPTPRTRKIALRSAITFSPDRGGVFDVLSNIVRCGLGGRQGSGRQYVSWVHDTDFIRAIEFLIAAEEFDGVVNIASPNPLPNHEFLRVLRTVWRMPIGLPAPEWLLEIGTFLLRTETELVLKSRRVIPGRLKEAGFEFQYPDWPDAAHDLVQRLIRYRS